LVLQDRFDVDEEWDQIDEFPDYSVSSFGRIRNDIRDAPVCTSLTLQGAVKVGLMKGGVQYTRSVKVIVAERFVPQTNPMFNTPIHLDCDQQNNRASNLVWRPRWFAWKYAQQLVDIEHYYGSKPIMNLKTGVVYANVVEAAMANGLLFWELQMSAFNQIPVFPSWQLYGWA